MSECPTADVLTPNLGHSVAFSKYYPWRGNDLRKLALHWEMRAEGRPGGARMGDGQ